MNLFGMAMGLCFVVPFAAYAGRVLSRRFTWPAVEGKVFRVRSNKAEIKVTYVVDGRSRTAVKSGWTFGTAVGDKVVVHYDPDQPFRYQLPRPFVRSLSLFGLALLALAGVAIMAASITGSGVDPGIDLPWFVSIGMGLIAGSIGGAIIAHHLKRRSWRQVDGTIMNVRESKYTDSDGGTTVTYDVTYKFADDVNEVRRQSRTSTFFRRHEQGEAVTVRYDPADPDRSDIATSRDRLLWWASAIALVAVGVGLVVLGFLDVSASTA